jgi:tetratricopeptide (TPR) repeat protein
MIVSAVLTVLFFSKPSVFILPVSAAIWGLLLKYSYAVLKNTAQGRLSPPEINMETMFGDFGVVFKQIAIYVIVGVVFLWVAKTFGPIIGLFFLLLAILSLPAMIIVLATTSSLFHAINPMVFAVMALRIGWGYLLMYFFLSLLGAAPTFLARYFIAYLPAGSHLFLFTVAKSFYTLISYHLMGYVMFQYHGKIGYEIDSEDMESALQDKAAEPNPDKELLTRVDILIKEGRIDDAIALIKGETKGAITNLNLAERYYNLLKLKQLTPEMLSHGRVYLDLLAKAGNKDRLCEVYRECVAKDTAFSPHASAVFQVANSVGQAGNPKEAIAVYHRFIKENSGDPLVPKAYFLAANVMNEKLQNPRKAVRILNGLILKFPNHEIVPYAQQYLSKIAATSSPL